MICFPSIAPMQFGKFHSSWNSLAIRSQSLVADGTFRYCSWRASHIALHISRKRFDIVDLPMRNKNEWVCWESPVIKYLNVTIRHSASEIEFLDRHSFFAMNGPTRVKRSWKPSKDILVNLEQTISLCFTSVSFLVNCASHVVENPTWRKIPCHAVWALVSEYDKLLILLASDTSVEPKDCVFVGFFELFYGTKSKE